VHIELRDLVSLAWPGISHIEGNRDIAIRGSLGRRDAEVGVLERGVAQAESERPKTPVRLGGFFPPFSTLAPGCVGKLSSSWPVVFGKVQVSFAAGIVVAEEGIDDGIAAELAGEELRDVMLQTSSARATGAVDLRSGSDEEDAG